MPVPLDAAVVAYADPWSIPSTTPTKHPKKKNFIKKIPFISSHHHRYSVKFYNTPSLILDCPNSQPDIWQMYKIFQKKLSYVIPIYNANMTSLVIMPFIDRPRHTLFSCRSVVHFIFPSPKYLHPYELLTSPISAYVTINFHFLCTSLLFGRR